MGISDNTPRLRAAERDIGRGHYGKNLIYFPSVKNRRQIVCESRLEADYCLILEYDQEITTYRAHPITVQVKTREKTRKYTPDFLLFRRHRSNLYIEIKPDKTLLSDDYVDRLHQANEQFQAKGARLITIDAKEIRSYPGLRNLRTLYSRIHNTSTQEYEYLKDYINAVSFPRSITQLISDPRGPTLKAVLKAIFNQTLTTNLNERINLDSILVKKNAY